MADTRGCLGSVYRITGAFLAERGLLEDVKPRLSPSSQRLLDKPPFPFAWQDSAALEEIEELLYARSRDLVVDLGHAAGQQLSNSLVAPVLKMAMKMFGQTPASLFEHLDRFFAMVVRGFTFGYESSSSSNGVVTARIDGGDVHPSLFEQLRGNLLTIFDLCSVRGTVDPADVVRHDALGAEVRFQVRWE